MSAKAYKIKQVLTFILFVLVLIFFCMFSITQVKSNYLIGEEKELCETRSLYFFIIWFGTSLLEVLVGFFPASKKKGIYGPLITSPKEYTIKNIKSILDFFIKGFEENDFIKRVYKNNEYKVICYTKENKENVIINMIIKIDKITEKVYDDFEENYFENIGNKLLEDIAINEKKIFYTTIFIQVEKNNELFQKIVTENIAQGAWSYIVRRSFIVPIGIDLSSKKLYIATQQDGYGLGPYNYMKKNIIKEIDEFLKK